MTVCRAFPIPSHPPVMDLGKKTMTLLHFDRLNRTVSQVHRIETAKSVLRFKRHNRDTTDRPRR
jgi:hypothetical protein